jgi:hypothetical protein
MSEPTTDHMADFIRHALGADPPWWAEAIAEIHPKLAQLHEKARNTGGVLVQHPRTGRLILVERKPEATP